MGNRVPVILRYELMSFGEPSPMMVMEVGTGRVK